jgi:hypothetical protein
MEPEDDPEARIRELERPLADTARASEAGGGQPPTGYPYPPTGYPYPPGGSPYPPGPPVPPPPPPPWNYGGPLPRTSPRSPSGVGVWWIFAMVFVVGVVAMVGFAFYNAHRVSRGGSVTLSPAPSISPQTPGAGPSTLPNSQPTPPAGGNLSVSGIRKNQTIACKDSSVSVSGISNTVVITGHCTSLTVSGVQNSVTVDAADTIQASGVNNKVTYHSGSPSITNPGDMNVVQQG